MHPEHDAAAPEANRAGPEPPPGRSDGADAAEDTANGAARAAQQAAAGVAEPDDRLRRAMADLDNLRKRYARELDRERSAERSRVASMWLPVLDNLERALSYADADPASLVAGLQAVRDEALSVLAALGYPRQDEVGVPFDPMRHEVAAVVDDPQAPPGTVVRVLRPGYGEADRQLRPASVTVAGKQE